MKNRAENRIYDDYEALSRAAAALFTEYAREALRDHQDFRVALSGGKTPRAHVRTSGRRALARRGALEPHTGLLGR